MNHDRSTTNDHSTSLGTGPREFADAVPRGSILRNTEPVVSPVATPPVGATTTTSGGAASGMGATTTSTTRTASDPTLGPSDRLDASSRRVIDDPAAPVAPVGRHGAREVAGVPHRKFSLAATFLGWAVASFFTIALTALLLAALGGAALNDATTGNEAGNGGGLTFGDVLTLGTAAFVGWLVLQFVSYLIGGYAAGRIAHWNGAKHGAGVPVWAILLSLLALALGTAAGAAYADAFNVFTPRIDAADLTTYGILGLLGTLVAMFGGAILGGILGARHDQTYEGDARTARTTGRVRGGRPL